jgi:EAL and modified HD-GYP domain-containing signal transduction protein
MSEILIVRQPLFDRSDSAVGYELRFREAGEEGDPFARSYLSGSFDVLRSGLPAYVRCTRRQLIDRIFDAPDPRTLVVLLPPDVPADEETVPAVATLRKAGVTVALDEYDAAAESDDRRAPLFAHASHVRVDLRCVSGEQLRALAERVRRERKQLIADHVEDAAAHRLCMQLGFERFEGPHFSRPEPLPAAELPASTATALRLLALARDPNTSDRELEKAVSADPSLTFQLLRLVNSAASGGRGIESIGHAIRLVGRAAFVRWLALAFAASRVGGSGVDSEIARQAVQRARMCEALGGRDSGSLFLVGLFSLLDAMFRMPMADVVERVHLAPEAREALLDRTGPFADALNFVEAYELGLWESASELAHKLGLPADRIPTIYTEAVTWAAEQLSGKAGELAA